jgi:hypothetical protein
MTLEPLENLYFNWLCSKVVDVRAPTPTLSYWTLLRTLQNTEFVWILSGDDNRAEDGKDLRREFLLMADIPDHPEWRHNTPCSILEMFVAFSRRAEFMTDIPAKDWFWEFMENLELNEYNDASGITPEDIDEILTVLIWRTYDMNGQGGLFPIEDPREDQRHVEIWYQFCDYLVDQERLP